MSIRSMTGYGCAAAQLEGWQLQLIVRSVNHKALDVRVNLPREWAWLEPTLTKRARSRVQRGRLDLILEARRLSPEDASPLRLDEPALIALCAQLRRLSEPCQLPPPTWSDVLALRRLFEGAEPPAEVSPRDDASAYEALIDEALDRFEASRLQEGQTITQDMLARLDALAQGVALVEARRPALVEDYRQRLKARLDEVLQREDVQLDPQRLAQEVVLFADRTDIAEEIQRASAHLARLRALFEQPTGSPVGKMVDFYLQELIRETNTMASKSNFSELTERVVQMKSTIEQLREQSANIE